jgi:signal transduction histidine kinase
MRRLGLVWRITLVVLAALIAAQIVAVGIYFHDRGQSLGEGMRLPLPDQMAALVTVIDQTPPTERALLLRAVNGYGLKVSIDAEAPATDKNSRELKWVELRIRRYLAEGDQRAISVYLHPGSGGPLMRSPRLSGYLGGRVSVVVALTGGDYLVADAGDQLVSRLFGLPTGFWAGVIGFVVAALAVIAVIRETRPLSQLARSVERFGTALDPTAIPERGAREVRVLIRAFNLMQSRIAGSMQTRVFMIGAISHDLKTYLTRLRLRIESLSDPDLRMRAARDIEDMQTLLDDSLSFARDTFVGGPKDKVDLAELLERECRVRQDAGMPITLDLMPGPLIVLGSESALARAIGNLLDNAVKYGDRADVRLIASDDAATIQIDDDGPGIAKADRDAVFEPFRRLEASRNRDRGGAGLGRAIVRPVIDNHGGQISIAEAQGGGARFLVSLPRA